MDVDVEREKIAKEIEELERILDPSSSVINGEVSESNLGSDSEEGEFPCSLTSFLEMGENSWYPPSRSIHPCQAVTVLLGAGLSLYSTCPFLILKTCWLDPPFSAAAFERGCSVSLVPVTSCCHPPVSVNHH